jgi:hypothetical protein
VRAPRAAAAFLLAAALPGCIFAVDEGGWGNVEKRLAKVERRIERLEKERATGQPIALPPVSVEPEPPR